MNAAPRIVRIGGEETVLTSVDTWLPLMCEVPDARPVAATCSRLFARKPVVQQLWDHFCSGHVRIGKTGVTAVVGIDELAVIEAEGSQQRGVEIVDGDDLIPCRVAEVVGCAVDI